MESPYIERVSEFIQAKSISVNSFAAKIGMAQSTVNNYMQEIRKPSIEFINAIINSFEDVNVDWLMTGKGDMLKKVEVPASSVPFYESLPVSAGQMDTFCPDCTPSGYIQIPCVNAIAAFPVVGCSMEPVIHAGDIVAVAKVDIDNCYFVPDKIYMIVTKYERMIKHLRDAGDEPYIWAVSENYKDFKIIREDIVNIYQVVFYGRLV